MGVGISGNGVGDHGAVENKGVCEEAAGDNCGICSRETNIRNLYRRRADGGVQTITKVVGPRP